ncbi:MAG TPA: PH domain-containing protein [Herpetosiphonaceae bacterium]|nr:PH domain-containing protein [Herpetosiphonaceae bacterium]
MSRPRIQPQSGERWIYVAHRHWIALVMRSALPLVGIVLAGGLLSWRVLGRGPDVLGRVPPLFDAANAILAVAGLLLLFGLVYTCLDWSNDHLIVSNKRLIYEDQTLLLTFRYETIPLDRIQNVDVRVANLLQYLLKYGRVEVQAAGPTAPIVFDHARCPDRLQVELMKEVNREKREQEQRRLKTAIQRHLDPTAPPAPTITDVPAQYGLQATPARLGGLLPLGPVVEGDTIIWRQHWTALLKRLLWPSLALLAWLSALMLLPRLGLLSPTATTWSLFAALVVIGFAFFWQWSDWRNDLYILEPSRLIDVSRLPFGLYEDRREAPLGVIQNVNAASPHLVARMLGYGDVLVETAGQSGNFTFDHVPDPDQVQRIISEFIERSRWQAREREWNNALTIMEMYEQARRGGTNSP